MERAWHGRRPLLTAQKDEKSATADAERQDPQSLRQPFRYPHLLSCLQACAQLTFFHITKKVGRELSLKPNVGSDRSWVWHVPADFAEGEPKPEVLAIRFANSESTFFSLSFIRVVLIRIGMDSY